MRAPFGRLWVDAGGAGESAVVVAPGVATTTAVAAVATADAAAGPEATGPDAALEEAGPGAAGLTVSGRAALLVSIRFSPFSASWFFGSKPTARRKSAWGCLDRAGLFL